MITTSDHIGVDAASDWVRVRVRYVSTMFYSAKVYLDISDFQCGTY